MVFQIHRPKFPGADTPSGWKPCLEHVQPCPAPAPSNHAATQTPDQTPEQREQREAPGSARGVGPGLSVVASS